MPDRHSRRTNPKTRERYAELAPAGRFGTDWLYWTAYRECLPFHRTMMGETMSPLIKSDAKMRLLGSIPLFATCNSRQLRRIAALTVALDLPAGEVLCREGQAGTEFFVIVEGGAAVSVKGRRRATIGAGGFCGELAILDGGPRVASVSTTVPTRVLVLSRSEFQDLLKLTPEIALNLLRAMAGRLRDADLAQREQSAGAPIGS